MPYCSTYLGKVTKDQDVEAFLRVARKMLSNHNKNFKWEDLEPGWSAYYKQKKTVWRLLVRWRLGYNNPHAHLYRAGGALAWTWRCNKVIRKEHAQYASLYLYKAELYKE